MALPIKTVAASMAPVFSSEKMGRNHGNKNTASKRERERKVGGAYAHAEEGAWKKRCSSKGLSSMATTNQLGKKIDWEEQVALDTEDDNSPAANIKAVKS
ncbi:hypothetical protein NC651_025057 [Populus alba x Populus x berolinensis]|nr:hypothetical protein NC651_025057 [Populus alba x Populus x berolinensis]